MTIHFCQNPSNHTFKKDDFDVCKLYFNRPDFGEGNGNPVHILAWEILPGGLPLLGSHRVGHN